MENNQGQQNGIQVNEMNVIQSLSKQISEMSMKIAVLEAYIQQLSESNKD